MYPGILNIALNTTQTMSNRSNAPLLRIKKQKSIKNITNSNRQIFRLYSVENSIITKAFIKTSCLIRAAGMSGAFILPNGYY
ncbi:MAG: hypothetical protein A2143_04635 [Gallionellales bacterium RBG_16_57_15]|nr:MAG: hypothetical protein A2143_04635 [Gallionellales bacterium RBG_16_57_15]